MELYQQLRTFFNRKHKDAVFDIDINNVILPLVVHTNFIITSSLNIYPAYGNSIMKFLLDLSFDAINKEDFHFFKKIVEDMKKQSSNSDYINPINYVNPSSGDTYLDIVSRNGLTEFAVFLLQNKAEINRMNETHNCGPIHFATENKRMVTLTVLLEQSTINLNLEASQGTALHIAVKNKDLECASLLLEKGVNVNIPNREGLTALHLAVTDNECQLDMVELILKKSQQYLDIDTSENNKETTRNMIRRKLPSLALPSKYFNVDVYEFERYLTSNNEEGFLDRIKHVNVEILHSIIEELLKMTVQHNCNHETVTEILKRLKKKRFNMKEPAEMATLQGRSAILKVLLCIGPKLCIESKLDLNDLLLSVCQQLGLQQPGKRNVYNTSMSDLLTCLKLILEVRPKEINVRYKDHLGNTPLYYAVQANCHEVVSLLLEKGSYLGDVFKGRARRVLY